MILTVNPNSVVDYTLHVPAFHMGTTMRADASAWGPGGKASDAAWILGKLGVPVLAMGFAAGPNGERMERMLQAHGVQTDFVLAEGDTRLNVVIVAGEEGQFTVTSSTLEVLPQQLSEFQRRFRKNLEKADCLVLGSPMPGGVPEDFFADLTDQARCKDIPVLLDSSGPALAAGLKARPTLVKPNRDELSFIAGEEVQTPMEAMHAAGKIKAEYGSDVVVTLGEKGGLALLGAQAYRVEPIRTHVVSTAGSGDGVLAGLALAVERKEPMEQGLRYGFALATAILHTLPTADFIVEDYERLLPQVQVEPYSE